jgi:release factor glutamine methyltransferase
VTDAADRLGVEPERRESVVPPRGAIAAAAATLAAGGLEEPRREAVRLWRELAGRPNADFQVAVARRAGGEPLAYVTGQAGFRHLLLGADRRALIPRPETEQLVELILGVAPDGRVADVGTGTGCIALSLAIEGRYRDVLAIERCGAALSLARENRTQVGAAVVRLIQGDLTESLAAASLDALVSNPPYLTDAEWREADTSVRSWEPTEALASGPDGLEHTSRILADGRRVLRPGGWLALELDCRRAAAVARRAVQLGWTRVQVTRDLFGRERFLLARRSEP